MRCLKNQLIHLLSYLVFIEYIAPVTKCRISVPGRSNNWAVIFQTSRFWFNYRHTANALGFYRTIKRLGIPDSNIILFLADDVACNSRNPFAGRVYNKKDSINVYDADIEVDYRSDDVSVENFIRVLTGRQSKWTPRSKRLLTDESSNLFIYLTGHGGEEFLKIQDNEHISSRDIGDALKQMKIQKRYKNVLIIADTCEAASLANDIDSPNVLTISSSLTGEQSLSMFGDSDLGVALIDRFTYYSSEFFEKIKSSSKQTLKQYYDDVSSRKVKSTPSYVMSDFGNTGLEDIEVNEFFASSGNSNINFLRSFCISAT